MNETAKVRPYVLWYCRGYGLDIGCGLEKIVPSAVGIDYRFMYNNRANERTAADRCGSWEEYWSTPEAAAGTHDYIFSSHLLEDYDDVKAHHALRSWLSGLKPGGYLILFLPIQREYECYSRLAHKVPNEAHKQNWEGVEDFIDWMPYDVLEQLNFLAGQQIGYSFFVVFRKATNATEPAAAPANS